MVGAERVPRSPIRAGKSRNHLLGLMNRYASGNLSQAQASALRLPGRRLLSKVSLRVAGGFHGFGLLAAGVSVTSYFSRLLPRWLVVLGMVVAIAGEFSSLSLVVYPANFLIPITRYLGFIWLILAAVKLTNSRRQDQDTLREA